MDARRELVIERVLRCVELVPEGRVAAYGVIAAICGIGPRQVGSILRHYGSDVPWWRITNHAGCFPAGVLARALPYWRDEGIAVKPNGLGCRYVDYAVDAAQLAERWHVAVADLPEPDMTDPGPTHPGPPHPGPPHPGPTHPGPTDPDPTDADPTDPGPAGSGLIDANLLDPARLGSGARS